MGIPVKKVPLIQVGCRLMNMWDHNFMYIYVYYIHSMTQIQILFAETGEAPGRPGFINKTWFSSTRR